MKHFVFYSKKCNNSANLLRKITEKKLDHIFHYESVDEMPIEKMASIGIEAVPAIVVRDQHSGLQKFEGTNAFTWLHNTVAFMQQQQINVINENRRRILQANILANREQNVVEYNPNETTGISDNYSYTSDALAEIAQPKSFQIYGADAYNRIATFDSTQEKKISEDEMKNIVTSYKNNYDKQINDIQHSIENGLKERIINTMN